MSEITHVQYTGGVPKAVTVDGIFSRDVDVGTGTAVTKVMAVTDCTRVSINRIFCWKVFPLLYWSFPHSALGKSRITLKTLGMKELFPAQIQHWGEKHESDFSEFVLFQDLLQHMLLSPFSSLTFGSSIQKTLTEARFTQMAKHYLSREKPSQCFKSVGMSRDGGLINQAWPC